jgi:Protein of unknown function (DUF3365)
MKASRTCLVLLGVSSLAFFSSSCVDPGPRRFSYAEMTDALFAVIAADRATYAGAVVDRLQFQEGLIVATEHFREEKALPLPAQMLRLGAERINQDHGPLFSYALLSPWPVNKQNGPRTESEKNGLRFVAETQKNHYTEEIISGKTYFAAYYPDKGVVEACVRCHNEHKDSPRRDFRVGDVMGGVVIRVWMER